MARIWLGVDEANRSIRDCCQSSAITTRVNFLTCFPPACKENSRSTAPAPSPQTLALAYFRPNSYEFHKIMVMQIPTLSLLCRRCGQCCVKGGPALHLQDLHLLESGIIPRRRLVTLRQGETVYENISGGLCELQHEIVKVAGQGTGFTCGFYDYTRAECRIHASRPAECQALFCEDTSAIEQMYSRERLTRADIMDSGGALWELIIFHDQAFPATMAVSLARKASEGQRKARESLLELTETEENFRRAFLEKTGITPEELDFYFGRSLARICSPFGARFPR
jgi:Fe-S-cluster containining protein